MEAAAAVRPPAPRWQTSLPVRSTISGRRQKAVHRQKQRRESASAAAARFSSPTRRDGRTICFDRPAHHPARRKLRLAPVALWLPIPSVSPPHATASAPPKCSDRRDFLQCAARMPPPTRRPGPIPTAALYLFRHPPTNKPQPPPVRPLAETPTHRSCLWCLRWYGASSRDRVPASPMECPAPETGRDRCPPHGAPFPQASNCACLSERRDTPRAFAAARPP